MFWGAQNNYDGTYEIYIGENYDSYYSNRSFLELEDSIHKELAIYIQEQGYKIVEYQKSYGFTDCDGLAQYKYHLEFRKKGWGEWLGFA